MSSLKRQKKQKKTAVSLDDVKDLGTDLLTSTTSINNLPRLIAFLSPSSPSEFIVEAVLALQPFFVTILPEIYSYSRKKRDSEKEESDPEVVYKEWIRSRFDDFVDSLIKIAVSEETDRGVRDVAVDAIMDFVKLGKGGVFQSDIYYRFINSLIHSGSSVESFLSNFAPNYFKYLDVCYYTYISLFKITEKGVTIKIAEKGIMTSYKDNSELRREISIHNVYKILSQIPSLESRDLKSDYAMWNETGSLSKVKEQKSKDIKVQASTKLITKRMKSKFTKAWTSFLRIRLPVDVYKEVLVTIHQIVIPNISNPVILCDFLKSSYDMGGVISVMSLSGLFILMTEHSLEYPNYYIKLYALMTPDIFMAKYRARFFQLLDISLKSTYLPAYLAAAFAKKMSRLALSVPPSGALVIIAIIHNLLRRHPSINFLVDKVVGCEIDTSSESVQHSNGGLDGFDPFKIEEEDPVKSDAMRSSLWEIETLSHHYCPAVSRFVASLENDLTVRNKTTEITVTDFASGSYSTIFGEEVRRRIKQVPLAFYKVTPTSLFSESDFAGWSFVGQPDDEKKRTFEADSSENTDVKRRKTIC
ncbi:Nucleolar complex protein 4 [Zostera marina]|uniref:Nucleolar complex protein 4 n=1 Tax=Zostera marina TaxID=29655 RepID=A0A0K9PRI4_ZOSMR|nr:Nucleolar complex protein 4 [Zostera marina]